MNRHLRHASDQTTRHGFTIAHLHAIARHAVHVAGNFAAPWHERYDTAWTAIVEHLYASSPDAAPSRGDLVTAGQRAIYAEITAQRQRHGYYRAHTDGGQHGPASSPAYRMYWWDLIGATPSPETRIVERTSLAQILPMLTPQQRRALAALAVHDSYQQAAAAIGLTDVAFKSLISRGRARFFELWHQGEVPSRGWGVDRRAGKHAAQRRQGGSRATLEALRRRTRRAL